MSGFEAATAIRAHELRTIAPRIPIVVCFRLFDLKFLWLTFPPEYLPDYGVF